MTTERILGGRTLETPPLSFQPVMPSERPIVAAASTSMAEKTGPDLIQRYNLSGKVGTTEENEEAARKVGWSSNKVERQSALQKRREEMIIAARRKMMDKGKGKQVIS